MNLAVGVDGRDPQPERRAGRHPLQVPARGLRALGFGCGISVVGSGRPHYQSFVARKKCYSAGAFQHLRKCRYLRNDRGQPRVGGSLFNLFIDLR